MTLARVRKSVVMWAVAGGLVLAATVVAVIGLWPPSIARWGTLADWVAAVPTAAALLIGALAYRQQVGEQREARLDALMAQARLVTAWLYVSREWEPILPRDSEGRIELDPTTDEDSLDHAGHWGLRIRNASSEAVYDVEAIIHTSDTTHVMHAMGAVVAPGETLDIERAVSSDVKLDRFYTRRPGVMLRFRDAAGRSWIRHPTGALVPDPFPDSKKTDSLGRWVGFQVTYEVDDDDPVLIVEPAESPEQKPPEVP